MHSVWLDSYEQKRPLPKEIPKSVDVVVVGGGITGVALLVQLLLHNIKNVVLLEEHDIGYHATGRGTGQVCFRGSKLLHQVNSKFYSEFIYNNNKALRLLISNLALDVELSDSGGIHLSSSEEETELLKKEAEYLSSSYTVPVEMNKIQIDAIIGCSNTFEYGLYHPNEYTLNPYKLVNGLARYCTDQRILTGTRVDGVVNKGDHLLVNIRNTCSLKTKKIVYCNNTYYNSPEVKRIKTDNILGNLANFSKYSFVALNGQAFFRSYEDLVMIGLVNNKSINPLFDSEVSLSRCKSFAKLNLPEMNFMNGWASSICKTPDGLPIIGMVSENEYIMTGFDQFGLSHFLAAGSVMMDVIAGKNEIENMFNPGRFNNV